MERPALSMRRFKNTDLRKVRDLIYDTIDSSYVEVYPPSAITFFKAYHTEENILRDSKNGLTMVIEDEGGIIATGTLLGSEIKRVFVSPGMQGHGLGMLLMEHLMYEGRNNGLQQVFLDSSLVSNGFYARIGFLSIRDDFIIMDDGGHLDYKRMVMSLKGNTAPGRNSAIH